MQSPSSLIFLVLLGVWAAYFVQYWVRRRDHLSTARSVEEFTEAMRVLERRDALPRTDLSEPAPRSYAVHPARAARPQVIVKRAVASDPAPLGVTERIDEHPDAVAPVATSASAVAARAVEAGAVRSGPAARAASPAARPRVRPSRRVRGLLLLAALAELLVIAPLVGFAMLPPWALAPALLAVAGAFLFLRSGVRAEAALARAARRRAADLARRRTSAPVAPRAATARRGARATASAPVGVATDGPAAATSDVEVVAEPAAVDTNAAADADTVGEPAVAEPVAETAAEAAATPAATTTAGVRAETAAASDDVMVPIVDEDDIPLTWDPVPVPRPTYTMKAKAERPEVAPAAVTPDPAPVVRERDEAEYDERRVAGA